MTDIKFIGTNQVELVNSLDESNKISPIQVGENFIEFSFNSLSKDSSDFYHFQISGSNVQVSGQITEVHNDYQFFNLFAGKIKDKQPNQYIQTGCENITDASQLILSAPTAKKFCYSNMFKDCVNLITPPSALGATTLDDWCYQGMFAGCSKMISAPQLPATTLAPYCYYAMFYGCKSLTSAPRLSASTLVDWCYNSMFFNCQSVTSISADFTDWNTSENSTKNWVTGIETEGNFYNDNVAFIYGVNNVPEAWKDYSKMPLTFTGKAATNAVCLSSFGSPHTVTLQYSKNNGSWINYSIDNIITLNQNETVAFRSANDHFSKDIDNYYHFTMTGTIEASGNIQSLMDYSNSCTSGCYYRLFSGCASLTNAPNLPATGLAEICYQAMFSECINLSTAPQLPATELAENCYSYMFANCSNLSSAPQLPATTLADSCYFGMFLGCSKLSSINVNFTQWDEWSTVFWISGVPLNRDCVFYKPSTLPEEFGINRIPQNWTVINK